MQIIAIDFGLKKVGVAISTGTLAAPLCVLRYASGKELIRKINQIIEDEMVEKVVVGISEGKMAERTKEFAEVLRDETGVEVELIDETLSTQEAQTLSIEAGIKRKKRKEMEDAFAAAVILQNYLEKNN